MNDQIPFYSANRDGDSLINKIKRVLTSGCALIVAFIVSNLLLKAISASMSLLLKYKVKLTYNQILVTPWDYHYWSRPRIILTTFFPPIVCLVLGLFIFNLLRINSEWSGKARIFLFWLSVTMVNMILTHLVLAPLASPYNIENGLYQTFAVVWAWYYLNPAIMVMAAIAALIMSLGLGMLIRNEIMRYSFSKKLIGIKEGMDLMTLQVYVFPSAFAIVPLLMLCTRTGFFTTLMEFVNFGVVSMGIFAMNSIGRPNVRCHKGDVLNHIPVAEFIIGVLIWLPIFFFFK